MSRVAFLLVPGVHLLDLAGPAQVFASAADLGHDYRLHYLAERSTVSTAQGLSLVAETDWPALTEHDLIVVPGWRVGSGLAGTGPLAPSTLDWLREHVAVGGAVVSVCAGADALGRGGPAGRSTVHHPPRTPE